MVQFKNLCKILRKIINIIVTLRYDNDIPFTVKQYSNKHTIKVEAINSIKQISRRTFFTLIENLEMCITCLFINLKMRHKIYLYNLCIFYSF